MTYQDYFHRLVISQFSQMCNTWKNNTLRQQHMKQFSMVAITINNVSEARYFLVEVMFTKRLPNNIFSNLIAYDLSRSIRPITNLNILHGILQIFLDG